MTVFVHTTETEVRCEAMVGEVGDPRDVGCDLMVDTHRTNTKMFGYRKEEHIFWITRAR